jgi:ADP-ribose pyrophosphatase YjhB (NUDIX family)
VKRIALIIATNGDGKLLLGKRRDNGKWTVPGGHLNEGEDPWDGAVRELKEETGLTPDDDILDKVDERSLGQAQFYTFLCSVTGKPTGKNDPDEECSEWRWFDVKDGLPKEVQGNLAGPRDESKNIIVDHFGLAKGSMARLAPIRATDRPSKESLMAMHNWQGGGVGQDQRQKIPRLNGPLRMRALHRLSGATSTRINPSGEREFLLHRGMSDIEHQAATKNPGIVNHDVISSWTPNHNLANQYAYTYRRRPDQPARLVSAWVKESAIQMIPNAVGNPVYSPGPPSRRSEYEIFVNPNHNSRTDMSNMGQLVSYKKHEEDDEVMRLLLHPNRDERRMALKLGTVNDRHLMRALTDEDPSIQTDALNHPAMTHGSLMSLMHAPQTENLQLLGMNHKLFNREHLRALYDSHSKKKTQPIMDAITASDKLYPELMERMYHDGNGNRNLIARTDAPASIVNDAIEKHFVPGADQKGPHRYMTIEALRHPQAKHELAEKAIHEGDAGIQLAAAVSPGLPPAVAEDYLRRGPTSPGKDSFLRAALVRSPFATERHLDLGLEDPHPLVRAAVFDTQSPLLKPKHVDRAIEKGHLHDILMALKSKAANPGHLSKLANHKDPAVRTLSDAYRQKSGLKKFESNLGMFLKKNNLDVDPNSDIVRDMLGYNHNLMSTFDAAKFLIAGNQPSLDQVRKALWQHDGDVEKAALTAYGLEVNEGNLRALRAIRDISQHKKSGALSIDVKSVQPGVEEASDTAQAVERSFKDHFVFPVKLGGKHSGGTLIARDNKGGEVYLLKPGSGGISPAAGDQEESASQSRREAAFWHIADMWGLGEYLPQADLVIIDGKEFAAIRLLPWKYKTVDKLKKDDETLPQKLLGPYLKAGAIHKWAVLDYVLGNPDRHANNLMADFSNEAPHADVKLIDHGSAMAGEGFDPANDQNSFVPYYLRAWVIGPFNSLSISDKLKVMPRVDDHIADELNGWVSNLHAHDLQSQLLRYGIDPEPAMERLSHIKTLMSKEPVDLAINKLWITT